VVDYVWEGVQGFLNCKVNLVMNSSDIVCGFFCGNQVWRTFKAYRKGVELWPPGRFAAVCLNAFFTVFRGDGSND
jgi:hypothetical protein